MSPESPEGAASTRIQSRHFQEGTGGQGQGWAAVLEAEARGQVTPAVELLVDGILHQLCHMHVYFSVCFRAHGDTKRA